MKEISVNLLIESQICQIVFVQKDNLKYVFLTVSRKSQFFECSF